MTHASRVETAVLKPTLIRLHLCSTQHEKISSHVIPVGTPGAEKGEVWGAVECLQIVFTPYKRGAVYDYIEKFAFARRMTFTFLIKRYT